MAQVPTLPDGTPVAVELFSTSILSNHKVRARHDRFVSVLTVQRIPFVVHDLAADPGAKSRWRRKALIDPSIPGLLVHNEWRGTYEEFHEAVEFGELDLFLRIDKDRLAREAAAAGIEETTTDDQPSNVTKASGVNGIDFIPPPLAPEGSGARPEPDADETLLSMGLSGIKLSEADVDQLLAEVDAPRKPPAPKEPVYTVAGDRIAARTYVPSANAGVKPLRLARMPSNPAPNTTTPSFPRAPSAKYSASHNTSAALAAEAKATVKPRRSQGTRVASVVRDGADLPTALANVRDLVDQHAAGRETADDLFASLGLNDLTMTDAEAEAFLETGEIPEMLISPPQDKRWLSDGEKARHEAAARDLAGRKRDLGFGLSPAAHTSRRLSHSARDYMSRSASTSSVSGTSPILPVTSEAREVESPEQSASPLPPEEIGDNTAIDLAESLTAQDAEKVSAPDPTAEDVLTPSTQSNKDEDRKAQVSNTTGAVPRAPQSDPAETNDGSSDFVDAPSSVKDLSADPAAGTDNVDPPARQSVPHTTGVLDPLETALPKAAVTMAPASSPSPPQSPSPDLADENSASAPAAASKASIGQNLEGSAVPSSSSTSSAAKAPASGDSAEDDKSGPKASEPVDRVATPADVDQSAPNPIPAFSPETAAPSPAVLPPSPTEILTPATPSKAALDLTPAAAVPSETSAPAPVPTSPSALAPTAPSLGTSPNSIPVSAGAASSPTASGSESHGPSFGPRSTSKQSLIDLFPPSKKRVASGASSPHLPGTPENTHLSQAAVSPSLPSPSPVASSPLTPSVSKQTQSPPRTSGVASRAPPAPVVPSAKDPAPTAAPAPAPAPGKSHQRTLSDILRMADDVIAGKDGDDDVGLDSSLVDLL